MNITDKAKQNYDKYLNNHKSILESNDPEFAEVFRNFAFDEVLEKSTLDDRQTILVILTALVTNQSLNTFKIIVEAAIDMGISPVEIKEVIYQTTPYVGISKSYDFLEEVNYIFDEKGVSAQQPGQSTTTRKNRKEEGLKKQYEYFGVDLINQMIDNAPQGQEHFNDFLAGYCFGDFYTRTGLDDADRELITFVMLVSLRGCENQLRAHTQANLTVGNTKETLVSAITVLVPINGFPRTINALAIVNEICDNQE